MGRVGCRVRAADPDRRPCSAPHIVAGQAPLCDAARVRDLDELLAVARLQQRCLRRARDLLHDARRLPVPDERSRDLERVCQTLESRSVWKSTSELGCTFVNLHAIEHTQLQTQRRVDGGAPRS